jgi:hypothetical protein
MSHSASVATALEAEAGQPISIPSAVPPDVVTSAKERLRRHNAATIYPKRGFRLPLLRANHALESAL